MRTYAPVGPPTQEPSWRRGLLWGLAVGATIWGVYFIQASVFDWLFWDVSVVPALGLVLVGAAIVAMVRPHLRSFSFGLACGALATMPVVFLAFALLFAVFNLE